MDALVSRNQWVNTQQQCVCAFDIEPVSDLGALVFTYNRGLSVHTCVVKIWGL